MKQFILCINTIMLFWMQSYGQESNDNSPENLRKYYFVELISNPDSPELAKSKVDSIQQAHLANLTKMYEAEKLMLAGPFEGGGGLLILNVDTKEEAEKLVQQDPAVNAGRLTTRIKGWYTSKGVFTAEQKE